MTNLPPAMILCEIVGAQNLSTTASDRKKPLHTYCRVLDESNNLLHTTKTAIGTNPIWTATSKCLFLLSESKLGKSSSSKLTVEIYALKSASMDASTHKDLTNNRRLLGSVQIDKSTILSRCNGERLELSLIKSGTATHKSVASTLAVRFRIAQPSDQKILQLLESQKEEEQLKKDFLQEILHNHQEGVDQQLIQKQHLPLANLVTETSESDIAQSGFFNMVNNIFTASTVYDTNSYRELKRVKPHPDPKRPTETEFLPGADIRKRAYEPSESWVEAGSGQLGRLNVEVLACHNLPNMDLGEAVGDYTDPFVCLVYEDTVAMTDVIDDELSPHWLPWTQRAFSFGTMHPASTLYLAVFDFDLGKGNDHDPIGRVAINLSNLQHNMEYTLQYDLYPSSNMTDRTANGSITLRLRIECYDEKAALLSVLAPRPKINVNVRREKTFRVVRYTCFGEYDNEESFDLTVTRSYINEILEYKRKLFYVIQDTLFSLMFWRGQVDLFGDKNRIPLYSFLFFVSASHLVEKPHLIIPFTLLSISFMMMANFTIRSQHPSPWHRCPSIRHQVDILTSDLRKTQIEDEKKVMIRPGIRAYEGDKEAQAYEKAIRDRLELDMQLAEKKAEFQEELNSYGDDNIATEVAKGGLMIPADLQARLTRWQGIIGRICKFFRYIRIVALWEESILSFWITAAFFVSGILTLVLPWRFILLWSGRCIVWGLFGPHMKLVDLFLMPEEGNNKVLRKNADRLFQEARLRREEAVKIQDIKVLAFGEYSVQVPSFNVARHFDTPLSHSFAKPCHEPPKLHVARMIPGQHFYGTMIPRPEKEALLYAQNERSILQGRGHGGAPAIRDDPSAETANTASESHIESDDGKEVLRKLSKFPKGPGGNTKASIASPDEGVEVLPKNLNFLDDEGMEVVATGRLQSAFPETEEIELLRCKSMDSVLFHEREAQRNQDDADRGSDESGSSRSSSISSSSYTSSSSSVYSASVDK